MPSGLPLKWEVSFLLIQAEPASGRRLIARLRLYSHPVAALLRAGLIQQLSCDVIFQAAITSPS